MERVDQPEIRSLEQIDWDLVSQPDFLLPPLEPDSDHEDLGLWTRMQDAEKQFLREFSALIRHKNRRFRAACSQLIQLNNQLRELETRYNRANRVGYLTGRYSLHLRLTVMEGVRDMVHLWARDQALRLEKMMEHFYHRAGFYWTEDLVLDEVDLMDVNHLLD